MNSLQVCRHVGWFEETCYACIRPEIYDELWGIKQKQIATVVKGFLGRPYVNLL